MPCRERKVRQSCKFVVDTQQLVVDTQRACFLVGLVEEHLLLV